MSTTDTQNAGKASGPTMLNLAESQLLQSSLRAMSHAQGNDAGAGSAGLSATQLHCTEAK